MREDRSIESMKRFMDYIEQNNTTLLQHLEVYQTPPRRPLHPTNSPHESLFYRRNVRSPPLITQEMTFIQDL